MGDRFVNLTKGFRPVSVRGCGLIFILVVLLVTILTAVLADWSDVANVSNSQADSEKPVLAIDGNGTLHAAWEEEDSICYAPRLTDSDWSTPIHIPGCPQSSHDPSLTVGADNAVYLVWWSSDLTGLYGFCTLTSPVKATGHFRNAL